MSTCTHPLSAQYRDPTRGVVVCTLCHDVLEEQQFELDPIFERGVGAGGGGGRAGNAMNRGTAAGSLRNLGGSLRPTRNADGSLAPVVHNPRATIEQARREMMNIARTLEVDPVTVEIALGIYTTALRNHVVSGTRSVVLRACLYAACRRQRTTHIIYDFVEPNGDGAHAILTHMNLICEGTKTEVPVIDPSALVQRLAEQMDLGERTADVVVCALKVMRAMRDDWIACGRRPMGVCAAALLVGCYVFNIPRSPEQVCGMARLTSGTINKRLVEFSATPAAELDNIDDYQPSHSTLPPAFNDSSRKSTEEDMGADLRELSSLYYELVAEAKMSTPPTPERCAKWRRFLVRHCELEKQEPKEENLDLRGLSPQDQLRILGLPNTRPIPYEVVESSVKREEGKITLKVEQQSVGNSLASDLYSLPPSLGVSYGESNAPRSGLIGGDGRAVDVNDPETFELLTAQFKRLLRQEPEVRGLVEDFDFNDAEDEDFSFDADGARGGRDRTGSDIDTYLSAATQHGEFAMGSGDPSLSPAPTVPSAAALAAAERQVKEECDAARAVLEEIMRDKDRRHALPWEFVVLQDAAEEDATDLLPYLVLDNEERVRREKVGLAMYRDEWERGRPRTQEEIRQLEANRFSKRRRRQITEPQPVPNALERALQGRGAGVVNLSQLEEIMPGYYGGEDDVVQEDWE